jgi:uncharacterized protein DUF6932
MVFCHSEFISVHLKVQNAFGRFNRSDQRPRLTEKLRQFIAAAHKSGIVSAVIVDGSYITAKPEPADIDLILVLRADFDVAQELRPYEYNIQSKRMVRRLYGFDVLPAIDGSVAYDRYISEFSRVRLDDPEQTTNQRYKGLLRIDL